MSNLLKQSTARDVMVFLVDSADHITGKTGLTLTITASKNGAAFASISPTVTERGTGWYSLALTTSHTDTLGDLALHITATGADPADLVFTVVALLPGDAVTVGTNNDKTGYRLSATGVDDVWDEAQAGHTTAGTFGKYLDDEVSGVGGGGGGSHGISRNLVVRNQRTHRRLVSGTTITAVEVYGPDNQIAKTPVFAYNATADMADVTFTPDEAGVWTALGRDGSSNIVASDQVECGLTLPEWAACGLKPYEGHAFSYPIQPMDEGSSGQAGSDLAGSAITTLGTFLTRSWISKGKVVIPWDCTIYGMQILTSLSQPLNNVDSWRLYTVRANGALTGFVRSISDNVKNLTPDEGSWAGGGWKTVWFAKPVTGRLGDWWGFDVDDTSNGGNTVVAYYQPSTTNAVTAGQAIHVLNATVSLSQTVQNTWGSYGSVTGQFQIRLYISPPAIGITGLSHWAGSGASATGAASASIYTDAPIGPNRTRDLAYLLQEQMGLPVANLAQGSTDIRNWVGPASYTHNITSGGATTNLQLATPYPPAGDFTAGQRVRLFGGTTEYRKVTSYDANTGILVITGTNATTHTTVTYTPLNNGIATGLWENIVVPIHPALVVYDCVYNDCQAGYGRDGVTGFEDRDYLTMLDRLLVHADQSGIELAMLEAFGSLYAVQNNTVAGLDFSAQIERLNRLVRGWCQRNGILYIPLNWRLGQYDSTRSSTARYKRYAQKRYLTDFSRYGLPDYQATDVVHLTEQGRKAAAAGIATALKHRVLPQSTRESVPTLIDLSPPDSPDELLRLQVKG